MKLLTIFSPSHRELFETYLKPTAHEFELVARETPQRGTGEYLNPAWLDAMEAKVAFLCEQVQELQGETFAFADADVQFFPPVCEFLKDALGDSDIAFQDDISSCCAGLFVARANARVANLYCQLRTALRDFRGEQDALNSLLNLVTWKKLPATVFTIGMATQQELWRGQPVKIPSGLRAHHANYTIGVEKKRWLLNLVRDSQGPCAAIDEGKRPISNDEWTGIGDGKSRLSQTPRGEPTVLPRITIVTPSFNQAKFLHATLRSVHEQEYANLEHIVIDGGSTDGSQEIIQHYESQLAYWCSEPDRGQCDAINKGFARATGEILGWLNSDDTLEPGALWAVSRYFTEHPDWGCLTGGAYAIDERGCYLDHNSHALLNEPRPEKSIRRCPKPRGSECFSFWTRDWFPQPATFWRRSVWEQTGPLDENLHYSMDYELWRRIGRLTEIHPIQEVLANCRYHADCKTIREIWGPLREVVAVNAAQMSEEQFRRFGVEVTEWLIQRLEHLEHRKLAADEELYRVRQSPTYRMSKWLGRPLSLLKRQMITDRGS